MGATKVFSSMSFAICALVFLTLIYLMYKSKEKRKITKNKTFKVLLVLSLLLLVLEILYIHFFYKYGDGSTVLISYILCRTYIIGTMAWMLIFIYYILCLGINNIEKVDKRKKIKRILLISLLCLFFIASTVSTFVEPISTIIYLPSLTNYYRFSGPAVYFNYIIGAILMIIMFIVPYIKIFRFKNEQRIIIHYSLVFFLLTTVFMASNYDFNILTFQLAFLVATLYFTVESQDNKLVEDLKKSKDEAEIANKAKTEFLSNMSHEIRTPMNTILGFSESLLSNEVLTEEMVKNDTKSIHEASLNLLDLINNILDISRIEAGKSVVEKKAYDLKDVIYDIEEQINPKINDKIKFDVNVNENMPKKYYGDYIKIIKASVNVLINAIKHTNYGEVSISFDTIRAKDDNCDLKITIANTGHAMADEEFNLTFEEFVKIGNDSDNNIDNVTLGLIIAKKIIEMLDGKITFVNKTGEGTKYFITIPQTIVDNDKIGSLSQTKNNDNDVFSIDLSSKNILIVDDNELNIKVFKKILERFNPNIECANSGKECIEKVKNDRYDLIFLDHMMPEMDGVETLKNLKDSGFLSAPVIALTANSYSGIRDEYIKEGFTDYLAKPINPKELARLIDSIFNNK